MSSDPLPPALPSEALQYRRTCFGSSETIPSVIDIRPHTAEAEDAKNSFLASAHLSDSHSDSPRDLSRLILGEVGAGNLCPYAGAQNSPK